MFATASKPAHDVEEVLRNDPDYLSDSQRVAREKLNVIEFGTANVNELLASKIWCDFASIVNQATLALSHFSGSKVLHHNLNGIGNKINSTSSNAELPM